jgi:hypothetical protein
MSRLLKQGLNEFLSKFVDSESNKVDVLSMLSSTFKSINDNTLSEAKVRERMMGNLKVATDIHEEFVRAMPYLHQANGIEAVYLKLASEQAFPYWFALDWFFTSDGECSAETPLLCLPPDVLGTILLWKQISAFVIGMFLVILLGAMFGFMLSPRKMKRNVIRPLMLVLICLVIDFIGAASLIMPVFGNVVDIIWAPISSLLVSFLFRSPSIGLLVFLKEALIITDVIPLATVFALNNLLQK